MFKIPSEPPKETLFVRTLLLQKFYEEYWIPEIEKLDKEVDEWAKKSLEAELPLTLRVVDTSKKLVEKAQIYLVFKSGEIKISLPNGELSLTFDKELLPGLECRVDTPYFLSPQIIPQEIYIKETWTVSIRYDTTPIKPEVLDIKKYQKINAPPVVVYYSKDYEKFLARTLLDTLLKCEKLIKELTGESVTEWKNVLVKVDTLGKVILPKRVIGPVVFAFYKENLKDSSTPFKLVSLWLLAHERTELPLARIFYSHSPEARWIGDGIAEYVSYKICKKLASQECAQVMNGRIKQIEKLFIKKGKIYNLTQEFKVGMEFSEESVYAGYPISFYIWCKATEKAGDGVIKEFISKAKELKNPTNEDYMNLLSKLTGLNIKEMVTNVDLSEVLKFFKKLKCE